MQRVKMAACFAAVLSVAIPTSAKAKVNEGFLVLRRGEVLEAMRADGSQRQILTYQFGGWPEQWDISRDGRRVCFTASGGEFFSARAGRSYLYLLDHGNPEAQTLLRAYGTKDEGTAQGVTGYNYASPSFDATGQRILVTEEDLGDHYTNGWLALYDVATRSSKWNSLQLAAQFPLPGKRLYDAAISPDGSQVLCGAVTTSTSTDAIYATKDLKHYLVHFDLRKKVVEVLAAFERPLHSIVWHPDSKRFALSVTVADYDADIYASELGTAGLRRLTRNAGHDFNPVWNQSGTRLFWLSNRLAPKPRPTSKSKSQPKPFVYRLFSMKPDGSNQRAELPRVTSIDSVRHVDSLPSWRRFREKQVFAAVGIKS